MQLASHLGLPLQQVKATTTVSEFFEWCAYLKHHPQRQDYYLAQIAAEVCRSRIKDPSKVKLDDFLLRYNDKEEAPRVDTSKMTEAEKKAYRKKLSEEQLALWKGCTATATTGSKQKPIKQQKKDTKK